MLNYIIFLVVIAMLSTALIVRGYEILRLKREVVKWKNEYGKASTELLRIEEKRKRESQKPYPIGSHVLACDREDFGVSVRHRAIVVIKNIYLNEGVYDKYAYCVNINGADEIRRHTELIPMTLVDAV